MTIQPGVVDWLLDSADSDPSIGWQVMRDLLDQPESEWAPERSKVETEGWGATLLDLEDESGMWANGAHFPNGRDYEPDEGDVGQPWTATSFSLSLLREFGLDPTSKRIQRSIRLIGENARWEHDFQPYWEGEVEPCINGITVANGTYFGVDMTPVVERLVVEVLADGGWNCESENGSVRSSFHTTINVLEGLLEYEKATGGTKESRDARLSGEEYLLKRALFQRLSTGEPAEDLLLSFINPYRWRHQVLRGLDYFRSAALLTGSDRDPRLTKAIEYVRSRQNDDGTWNLDWSPSGRVWFEIDDGEGKPSRWITLKALRVLKWWDA